LLSGPGGVTGPEAKTRATQGQESIRTARDLLEGLRQEFPEVPPYREELVEVHANLGKLEQRSNRHAQAIADLRRAEVLADQLVGEFPDVPKHRVQAATVCRRQPCAWASRTMWPGRKSPRSSPSNT
jgi:hypothetical protein